MRVLGIDTSLRSTGVGVVEARGHRFSAIEFGRIHNAAKLKLSECLRRLDGGIREIIQRAQPEAVAVEGIFFCKNVRTAVILGEARGAVLAACAGASLPVYEYSPRRVKQAVAGFGGADKSQVRKMVMSLLDLRDEPQEDAGDALAIAICHLNNSRMPAVLAPKTI
jgi:crossover junction endodeoxyribonuclease RuvC